MQDTLWYYFSFKEFFKVVTNKQFLSHFIISLIAYKKVYVKQVKSKLIWSSDVFFCCREAGYDKAGEMDGGDTRQTSL